MNVLEENNRKWHPIAIGPDALSFLVAHDVQVRQPDIRGRYF